MVHQARYSGTQDFAIRKLAHLLRCRDVVETGESKMNWDSISENYGQFQSAIPIHVVEKITPTDEL